MVKFKKGEIPFIYLLIYSKLKSATKKNRYVRPKTIKEWIRRSTLKIPNHLFYPIMAQLEEHGLIRKVHQKMYEVIETDDDKKVDELRHFTFW